MINWWNFISLASHDRSRGLVSSNCACPPCVVSMRLVFATKKGYQPKPNRDCPRDQSPRVDTTWDLSLWLFPGASSFVIARSHSFQGLATATIPCDWSPCVGRPFRARFFLTIPEMECRVLVFLWALYHNIERQLVTMVTFPASSCIWGEKDILLWLASLTKRPNKFFTWSHEDTLSSPSSSSSSSSSSLTFCDCSIKVSMPCGPVNGKTQFDRWPENHHYKFRRKGCGLLPFCH